MTDLGLPLTLASSIVALWGVYLFNQRKDYTGARAVWFWSNTGFVIYFSGRCLGAWNGGFSDAVMAIYFALMWWSNVKGMVNPR